jgi:hypothetical protein
MMAAALPELPAEFATTRHALHALAEHILAAARYHAAGHIGLCVTPGGFGTPPFGDGQVVRVDGVDLVHEIGGKIRRAPITTLAAAADFVGIAPGAPDVYTAVTAFAPDVPLTVDPAAVATIATWYAFVDDRLAELVKEHPDATDATLWPEHLDLALSFGEANFGGSPGDATIGEPYLYAGPWAAERLTGMFSAYPWGAAVTYSELRAEDDADAAARAFFLGAARALDA